MVAAGKEMAVYSIVNELMFWENAHTIHIICIRSMNKCIEYSKYICIAFSCGIECNVVYCIYLCFPICVHVHTQRVVPYVFEKENLEAVLYNQQQQQVCCIRGRRALYVSMYAHWVDDDGCWCAAEMRGGS